MEQMRIRHEFIENFEELPEEQPVVMKSKGIKKTSTINSSLVPMEHFIQPESDAVELLPVETPRALSATETRESIVAKGMPLTPLTTADVPETIGFNATAIQYRNEFINLEEGFITDVGSTDLVFFKPETGSKFDLVPTLELGELLMHLRTGQVEPEKLQLAEDDPLKSAGYNVEDLDQPIPMEQIVELFEEHIALLSEPEEEAMASHKLETVIELAAQIKSLGELDFEEIAVLTEEIEELCGQLLDSLGIVYDEAALKAVVRSFLDSAPQDDDEIESAENIWYEGMNEITSGNPTGLRGTLGQFLKQAVPSQLQLGKLALTGIS
jgi:hypothetical protein